MNIMARRTTPTPQLKASMPPAQISETTLPLEKPTNGHPPQIAKNGKGLAERVRYEMKTGDAETVPVRVSRVLDSVLPPRKPPVDRSQFLVPAQPGEIRSTKGCPPGRTLMNEIRLCLKERAIVKKRNGKKIVSDRFHGAAEAFARKLEQGEFPFHKEFIDREEGKVAVRIDQYVNQNVKLYAGMPLEGPDAP